MSREEHESNSKLDLAQAKKEPKKYHEEISAEASIQEMDKAAASSHHEMPPLESRNYNPNKKTIVAVRRNGDGDITAVKFHDNSAATITEAIEMVEMKEINNVNVGMNKLGYKTLKTNRDSFEENNLSELP